MVSSVVPAELEQMAEGLKALKGAGNKTWTLRAGGHHI